MTDIDAGQTLAPVIEEDDSFNTSQRPLVVQNEPLADNNAASDGRQQPLDVSDNADQLSTGEHPSLPAQVKDDLRKMRKPDV